MTAAHAHCSVPPPSRVTNGTRREAHGATRERWSNDPISPVARPDKFQIRSIGSEGGTRCPVRVQRPASGAGTVRNNADGTRLKIHLNQRAKRHSNLAEKICSRRSAAKAAEPKIESDRDRRQRSSTELTITYIHYDTKCLSAYEDKKSACEQCSAVLATPSGSSSAKVRQRLSFIPR